MSPASPAQQRTREDRLKGFWIHLFFYVLVNAGLIALDLSRGPEKTWFYWPLGGWGIGIVCHACAVFNCHRREQMSQGTTERPASEIANQR